MGSSLPVWIMGLEPICKDKEPALRLYVHPCLPPSSRPSLPPSVLSSLVPSFPLSFRPSVLLSLSLCPSVRPSLPPLPSSSFLFLSLPFPSFLLRRDDLSWFRRTSLSTKVPTPSLSCYTRTLWNDTVFFHEFITPVLFCCILGRMFSRVIGFDPVEILVVLSLSNIR